MNKRKAHNFVDWSGKTIGRLTVKGLNKKDGKHYVWECFCTCGNTCYIKSRELSSINPTRSCGCLRLEVRARMTQAFTEKYKTHGKAGTREHMAWKRIKQRTTNPNCAEYPVYSLLGMEESWKDSFLEFLAEIGPIPDSSPRWSIGRIDNTLGYIKGNIRWETDSQQSKNKGQYKNNRSGVNGVYKHVGATGAESWVATYYDAGKKQHSKYFSISKYGDEFALLAATEYRNLVMDRLKLLGVEYGEHHGKPKGVTI